jgi:NAD(P)H dehydrogenase (quinone)
MCLPNKRQKDNFAEPKESGKDQKPPPVTSNPSQSPPLAPAPAPATQTQTTDTMSAPKVAIVIYSMYGHVAKRMIFPLWYSVADLTISD